MREFEDFANRIKLVLLLDPSGRAGNYFVQSVFDTHPEVISCPWVQYLYSYFITRFGGDSEVDSKTAHEWWSTRSYFRLIYQPLEGEIAGTIESFGSETGVPLDRARVREVFDQIVLTKKTISRKELFLAGYFAYLNGRNLPATRPRYILASDAVTLRSQNPQTGYDLATYSAARRDFPGLKVLWLTRDLRAAFASCRHQYVNRNGGMYGAIDKPWLARLRKLLTLNPDPEGCTWLYWIWYLRSSERATRRVLGHPDMKQIYLLRNEDLNLRFKETSARLAGWLEIDSDAAWSAEHYVPTNLTKPWRGKGAYAAHYHQGWEILSNDSPEKSKASAGPNKHVTERWKTALSDRERIILAYTLRNELEFYGYEASDAERGPFPLLMWLPWRGELPARAALKSLLTSPAKFARLILYLSLFPVFYVGSRAAFIRMLFTRGNKTRKLHGEPADLPLREAGR